MSASREKKQRQDGADLTPRQRRDLEESKRAKRNKVAYTITGVVAVILVAALLVWDSGLLRGNPVVATVNDQQFTASQVAYYYGSARQNLAQYAQYGLLNFDTNKKASEQTVDESTASTLSMFMGITAAAGDSYETVIQNQALDMLKQVTLLCDQASAEDYSLSEEGKLAVQSNLQQYKTAAAQSNLSYKSFLTANFGSYMSPKDMEEAINRNALAGDFQAYKAGTYTFTDAELETYYQENADSMDTYDYRYAQIDGSLPEQLDDQGEPIEATDAETAAAMSQAKFKAEAMAEELRGGADFAQTAAKYVSDTEAETYLSDPTYRHNTNDLGSQISASVYGQWLTSADQARKAGDVGVVEDASTSSYYVVQLNRRWRAEDTRGTVDARHILIRAAMDDGATEPTEAQYEAAKTKIEDIKAQWEAGDKTAESFAALAKQYSEDPGSKDNGGLYQEITPNYMVPPFNDFIFDPQRQVGDVGVVQNTQSGQQGYHLIYMDALGDIAWRHTALTALQSKAYSEWYEGVMETYTAAAAEGMSSLSR